jgi:CHASE2 domain-containing sensor protein
LQALSASPPAVIGFDILFAEESREDSQFADAMFAKGNVVLARVWDDQGKPLPSYPIRELLLHKGIYLHN